MTPAEAAQLDWILDQSRPLMRQYDADRGVTNLAAESRSVGRLNEPNQFGHRREIEPTRYEDSLPARPVCGAKSYVNLFGSADIRDAGGFKSFESFASCIARNQYNPLLQPINAADWHEESIGQDGGFSVPPAYRAGLLDTMIEQSVIMSRAVMVGMESNVVNAPGWVSLNSATPGGFQSQWTGEGELRAPQTGQMRSVTLKAKKYLIYADATAELLQDAQPSFAGQLQRQIGAALAHGLDTSFYSGNGVGQPLGIINAASTITVDGVPSRFVI